MEEFDQKHSLQFVYSSLKKKKKHVLFFLSKGFNQVVITPIVALDS